MEPEVEALLRRQADWQRRRADLTWEEKLRQCEVMRESLRTWRRERQPASQSDQ